MKNVFVNSDFNIDVDKAAKKNLKQKMENMEKNRSDYFLYQQIYPDQRIMKKFQQAVKDGNFSSSKYINMNSLDSTNFSNNRKISGNSFTYSGNVTNATTNHTNNFNRTFTKGMNKNDSKNMNKNMFQTYNNDYKTYTSDGLNITRNNSREGIRGIHRSYGSRQFSARRKDLSLFNRPYDTRFELKKICDQESRENDIKYRSVKKKSFPKAVSLEEQRKNAVRCYLNSKY